MVSECNHCSKTIVIQQLWNHVTFNYDNYIKLKCPETPVPNSYSFCMNTTLLKSIPLLEGNQ